jgi:hypothetical protein
VDGESRLRSEGRVGSTGGSVKRTGPALTSNDE